MDTHIHPDFQPPLKILSLDGGSHGLSSLLILEHIAECIQRVEGIGETRKPHEMFDFIGGTGTGGIIAIMLGRLKMTIEQSIQAYTILSEAIYNLEPKTPRTLTSRALLATKLESAFKEMVQSSCSDPSCGPRQGNDIHTTDTCPSRDALFQDKFCTKTAVLAMTKVNLETSPTIFTTYGTSAGFGACKVWEIARAISTANASLSVKVGRDEQEFVDAKYGYNNPCEVLIAEAKSEFPGREMIILSIGTGVGNVVEISHSKNSVLTASSKVATTAKQTELRLRDKYCNEGYYYRFNVDRGLEDYSTFPKSRERGVIASHTSNYLREKKYPVAQFVRIFLPLLQSGGQIGCPPRGVHNEADKKCLSDLYMTDPVMDKKNIEDKKGGLLKDCYTWILKHADYQKFKVNDECRILWIKGDPGKGKTMLLCGILDELEPDPSVVLSYFFCQATGDNQLNTATSVLRGLIYHLARHNPQLTKHVRQKYDFKGREMFNNAGSFPELCEILRAMLDDPTLKHVILIVDALDECSVDGQRLLKFISIPTPAKWIVSSRNWPDIEESLKDAQQKVKIHLEINQKSVSAAVESYIQLKTDQLADKKEYDKDMKMAVREHLRSNANGTFLWVALVCQELSNPQTQKRHTLEQLKTFPPGLGPLYGQMLHHIDQSKDADLCKKILAMALVSYRSFTLEELQVLVEEAGCLKLGEIEQVISLCGSFLAIHGTTIYFVHQSAKDYLLTEAPSKILPSRGIPHQHHIMFERSLDLLRLKLKRDVYSLNSPGYPINEVSTPQPDPLSPIKYSCIFWVNHLLNSTKGVTLSQSENGRVLEFFEDNYLQWLEALSLLKKVPSGSTALQKLEAYLWKCGSRDVRDVRDIVMDARRFLLSYAGIIEEAPLQAYISALIFSPTNSLIKRQFSDKELDWIEAKPSVDNDWSACLQTLEGHKEGVTSVVFSNDGQTLASGSYDKTVKIWDANNGRCLRTLKGLGEHVTSMEFANNGQRLISESKDKTVKIWDVTTGICVCSLENHTLQTEPALFSSDGQRLASWPEDVKPKIWDATSGECLHTLEGHEGQVTSTMFSNDGKQLASWSQGTATTIKVWDPASGTCSHSLDGHEERVTSATFSDNGRRLASGSLDKTVKIWDLTSRSFLHTSEGLDDQMISMMFSQNGQWLASRSKNNTIEIWDTTCGTCRHTFNFYGNYATLMALSNDGERLALVSQDTIVRIWDVTSSTFLQTRESHTLQVTFMVFSNDRQRLASGSLDKTIKIWETIFGTCLHTLRGHDDDLTLLEFSNDGQRLASGSQGNTTKIWDVYSGKCLHTLKGHDENAASVVLLMNEQRAALWSPDTTVEIWDVASGTFVQNLESHAPQVTSMVFSNNGQLASPPLDTTIKIWDATSGEYLHTLGGHNDHVTSVAFSDDGQRIATGFQNATVKIWEANSGKCLGVLEGHKGSVTSVMFSNDGRRLASGSQDKTVRIWDLSSKLCFQSPWLSKLLFSIDPFNQRSLSFHFGALDLDIFPSTEISSTNQTSLPTSTFTIDNLWIMKDGKRIVWLPPGYRPAPLEGSQSVLAHGSKLAVISTSGRVFIIGFKSSSRHWKF
ncbi:Vegetative incompatibility protein HET-E-1 [Ceratocystis fimbriata CBS 114723]|uniref:Vegetative incompatibility protein HET-E-1 n=1 Tax=Ceratocystis fimbriata CBS 114723 TaxID=1035309 RepID=A0A2C5WUT4_9PEZI|nr:Vegetative incompatibility protein HET-E-1 [Ceratocystis fimbriata CBS 114723]